MEVNKTGGLEMRVDILIKIIEDCERRRKVFVDGGRYLFIKGMRNPLQINGDTLKACNVVSLSVLSFMEKDTKGIVEAYYASGRDYRGICSDLVKTDIGVYKKTNRFISRVTVRLVARLYDEESIFSVFPDMGEDLSRVLISKGIINVNGLSSVTDKEIANIKGINADGASGKKLKHYRDLAQGYMIGYTERKRKEEEAISLCNRAVLMT